MLLLTACAPLVDEESGQLQRAPKSWTMLDVKALNEQIAAAIAGQETWPQRPLLVTVRFFGGDANARSLTLESVKNRGEGADAARVVVVRDGFLDDSTRGDWHEVDLRRLPDGSWRINTARAAYRCRRSANTDEYQNKPCP